MNLRLRIYEEQGIQVCIDISCSNKIYNHSKALLSYSESKIKRMRESLFKIRGKLIGKPQYGATNKYIYFPIELEDEIVASFKNFEQILNPGELLLIQSVYYCYVRKGDKIQIENGKLFHLTYGGLQRRGQSYKRPSVHLLFSHN